MNNIIKHPHFNRPPVIQEPSIVMDLISKSDPGITSVSDPYIGSTLLEWRIHLSDDCPVIGKVAVICRGGRMTVLNNASDAYWIKTGSELDIIQYAKIEYPEEL
jgi:hypothetical protein